jgi:hypothetical protein
MTPPKYRAAASGLYARLFLRIEAELGGLAGAKHLDPRFVTCVRFIPGTKKRGR